MEGKPKPVFVRDQNGVLRSVPPKHVGQTRLLYEILSPMYFPHFVNIRLKMLQTIIAEGGNKKGQETREETLISGRRVSDFEKELLNFARNTAVERKQKITILAALPNDMRKDLRDFSERHGMGFLAIDFDHVRHNLVLGRHDPHWNPQAHQLIAEQILSQVDWEIARRKGK